MVNVGNGLKFITDVETLWTIAIFNPLQTYELWVGESLDPSWYILLFFNFC